MGRRPCCRKEGLNRGSWSAFEDKLLTNYIETHGEGKWRDLPEKAGLRRCGKSCRLRWLNYLRPDIKRGNISVEEEDLIIRLHKLLGNRWSLIAGRLPGRTDNEIKNYWNCNLSKRVGSCGMHPRKSRKTNGCSNNYSMKPKQARATADESNRVIRTKAVRCSKVVIPGLIIDNQKLEIVGEVSPSTAVQLEDDLAGPLVDFDISELLLLDAPNSASPKAKEIGEHGGNSVAEGDYNNALQDLSYDSNHDPHFAHEANFDYVIDELAADNHGASDPFPEILDLKSYVEEWINRRQIDLDPQEIEPDFGC